MPAAEDRLGGRLALLARSDLSAAQNRLWETMDAVMGHRVEQVGYRSKTADGRFIGPFNPLLRSPEIGTAFMRLQQAEAAHSDLSERVREVVILSVGSVWNAPYELAAHAAVARAVGLSGTAVAALTSGASCSELSGPETIAQRFALALTAVRTVEDDLYARASQAFGEKGLVDLVVLAGCYHLVCALLNAFAVPVPDRSSLER